MLHDTDDFKVFDARPWNRLTILYDKLGALRAWFGFQFRKDYFSFNIMSPLFKEYEHNYTLLYQLHGQYKNETMNDKRSSKIRYQNIIPEYFCFKLERFTYLIFLITK